MRSSDKPAVDTLGDLGMHGVSSQMKRLYPHLRRSLPFLTAAGCLLGSAINLPAAVVTDKPTALHERPPNLPDYAGRYRSEESETIWLVQVKEGKLVLQQRRHGEIPLRPMARDRFSGSNLGSLQFEQDAGGKITGFKVTTGRVRNLRFERQLP
jgi:hypothetical protein